MKGLVGTLFFSLLIFCFLGRNKAEDSSLCETNEPVLPPLGKTGAYTSACRAHESSKDEKERRIFDPLASFFAGQNGMSYLRQYASLRQKSIEDVSRGIIDRTQFLDDEIVHHVHLHSAHRTPQVVIVGCGGDTRAFRLFTEKTIPVNLFEIDLPEVIQYRNELFHPSSPLSLSKAKQPEHVTIQRLGVDLNSHDWTEKLQKLGFDSSLGSIWVLEGILKYFHHGEELDHLMKSFRSVWGKGTVIIGDVVSWKHIEDGKQAWKSFGGGEMVSGVDDVDSFFEGFGFEKKEIFSKAIGSESSDSSWFVFRIQVEE